MRLSHKEWVLRADTMLHTLAAEHPELGLIIAGPVRFPASDTESGGSMFTTTCRDDSAGNTSVCCLTKYDDHNMMVLAAQDARAPSALIEAVQQFERETGVVFDFQFLGQRT